jgi:hypothetical protein
MSTAAHPGQQIDLANELVAIKRLLGKLLRQQQQQADPGRSLTISEWCQKRSYSRAYFYILKKQGRAPATTGTGHAARITPAADQAWQRDRDAEANSV